jgi:hypothetical protein
MTSHQGNATDVTNLTGNIKVHYDRTNVERSQPVARTPTSGSVLENCPRSSRQN